jgi:hypothetical protein
MHDLDQQVYETINDFLTPLPTEGCQQGVPNGLGVETDLTRRLSRSTEPILPEDFGLYLRKEALQERTPENLR